MTEETATRATETSHKGKAERVTASLAAAAIDVGQAWAEYGISYGKSALENTAKALSRTAQALETLKGKLRAEAEAEAPAEAAPPAPPAEPTANRSA